MTIIATLGLQLKPDDLDAAYATVTSVLEATRAFDGNLGVEVVVDRTDPAHVLVIERWRSIEDDEAYRAWRATPEGKSPLGAFLTGPPALAQYDSSEI